jgi:hypothetical protein
MMDSQYEDLACSAATINFLYLSSTDRLASDVQIKLWMAHYEYSVARAVQCGIVLMSVQVLADNECASAS